METFGLPHAHCGIGIRKLGRRLFECRGNRELRFLLLTRPDRLEVRFPRGHVAILNEIKKGKADGS